MPTLACHVCGRVVYATVPLDTLFAEERRCPRCGSILEGERREESRRKRARRQNPRDDPGPAGAERRIAERRQNRRRRDDGTTLDNS